MYKEPLNIRGSLGQSPPMLFLSLKRHRLHSLLCGRRRKLRTDPVEPLLFSNNPMACDPFAFCSGFAPMSWHFDEPFSIFPPLSMSRAAGNSISSESERRSGMHRDIASGSWHSARVDKGENRLLRAENAKRTRAARDGLGNGTKLPSRTTLLNQTHA